MNEFRELLRGLMASSASYNNITTEAVETILWANTIKYETSS